MLFLSGPVMGGGEENTGLTELTIGQSLNSVFLTIETSYAFDLYYRQTVGLSIMMFSAGIITPRIAIKKSDTDINHERARTINTASLWSGSTGMLLGMSVDMVDFRTQSYFGLAFDLLATSSAAYITAKHHLTEDSLAVINSGGIWGLVMGYGIYEVADADIRYTPVFLLAGQLAGLGGAIYAAGQEVISRERQAMIDLYVLFSGGMTYGALSLFNANKRIKWAITCIGFIAGAYIGYRVTDSWEKPEKGFSAKTEINDEYYTREPVYRISLPTLVF